MEDTTIHADLKRLRLSMDAMFERQQFTLNSMLEKVREFRAEFREFTVGIREDFGEFREGLEKTTAIKSESPKHKFDSTIFDSQNRFTQPPVIGKIQSFISPIATRDRFKEMPLKMVDDVNRIAFDGCTSNTHLFDPGGTYCVNDCGGRSYTQANESRLEVTVVAEYDTVLATKQVVAVASEQAMEEIFLQEHQTQFHESALADVPLENRSFPEIEESMTKTTLAVKSCGDIELIEPESTIFHSQVLVSFVEPHHDIALEIGKSMVLMGNRAPSIQKREVTSTVLAEILTTPTNFVKHRWRSKKQQLQLYEENTTLESLCSVMSSLPSTKHLETAWLFNINSAPEREQCVAGTGDMSSHLKHKWKSKDGSSSLPVLFMTNICALNVGYHLEDKVNLRGVSKGIWRRLVYDTEHIIQVWEPGGFCAKQAQQHVHGDGSEVTQVLWALLENIVSDDPEVNKELSRKKTIQKNSSEKRVDSFSLGHFYFVDLGAASDTQQDSLLIEIKQKGLFNFKEYGGLADEQTQVLTLKNVKMLKQIFLRFLCCSMAVTVDFIREQALMEFTILGVIKASSKDESDFNDTQSLSKLKITRYCFVEVQRAGDCVEHEIDQTVSHLWHRWKHETEVTHTFSEFIILALGLLQPTHLILDVTADQAQFSKIKGIGLEPRIPCFVQSEIVGFAGRIIIERKMLLLQHLHAPGLPKILQFLLQKENKQMPQDFLSLIQRNTVSVTRVWDPGGVS